MENFESISPYSFPGLKKELLCKKKYPYLFTPLELKLTKEDVLEVIATESGLTLEMILSKCRETKYVNARNIYCKILKTSYGFNLPAIARELDKDHTTIIWNIRKFDDRYKNEDDYKELSDRIFKKVGVKLK